MQIKIPLKGICVKSDTVPLCLGVGSKYAP